MNLPHEILRLPVAAGARLVLAGLYLDFLGDRAGELEQHLAGKGPAPFLALAVKVVGERVGYRREHVSGLLRELESAGEIRRGGTLDDSGRWVHGWHITPSWARATAAATSESAPPFEIRFELAGGRGPVEAERVLDQLFASRRDLRLTRQSRRSPTTQSELDSLARPMRVHGAGWADWSLVLRRGAAEVRAQAERRNVAPRDTGAGAAFKLVELCGARFAYLMNATEFDNPEGEKA